MGLSSILFNSFTRRKRFEAEMGCSLRVGCIKRVEGQERNHTIKIHWSPRRAAKTKKNSPA
jgi:hypothetical protein